jgi:glycine dehydrogenase subunit 1
VGETSLALAEHAKRRLEAAGIELLFPEQATLREFAVRLGRNAREAIAYARERGVHPGYALGRDYPGMDDALLVAFTEKRTPEDIDRLVEALAA